MCLDFGTFGLTLLLLLFLILRGCLTLLERFIDILGSLVGLALVVHGELSLTLSSRLDGLCLIGISGMRERTAFHRVELDIDGGLLALFVNVTFDFHRFSGDIISLLLVGEMNITPFPDRLYTAVFECPALFLLLLLDTVVESFGMILLLDFLLLLNVFEAARTGNNSTFCSAALY